MFTCKKLRYLWDASTKKFFKVKSLGPGLPTSVFHHQDAQQGFAGLTLLEQQKRYRFSFSFYSLNAWIEIIHSCFVTDEQSMVQTLFTFRWKVLRNYLFLKCWIPFTYSKWFLLSFGAWENTIISAVQSFSCMQMVLSYPSLKPEKLVVTSLFFFSILSQ